MPNNILILGGSGFLSGTTARLAVEAGNIVWTVTRGQRPSIEGTRNLVVDRKDRAAFAGMIHSAEQNWDLVIDCIGYEVDDARQDVQLFRDRAKQLVFVSTDFVYNPQQRNFPQSEEGVGYLVDVAPESYGGKKRLCEQYLAESDCGGMAWTIVRPGHIYGPGSLLGCLPPHGRDANLIERLKAGEAIPLVGAGHFLQQPIFAPDLAQLLLSVVGNEQCAGQLYCTAGPEVIESHTYYQIVADLLGVSLQIEEIPVEAYLAANPDKASFICHRFYDLTKLQASGLAMPSTTMAEGLRLHVESLL
ncbi:MAG: NAD-dependent epimerase/dehydratase family protein [Chloroflexota bacterium]